jgi:hypothetical protein
MSVRSDVCLAVCCNITGAKHCTNNVRPDSVYLVYCLFCEQPFILPRQYHHPRHHRLNSLSNTYNHLASNPSPLVRCGLKKQCPSKRRTNPTHSRPSPFQRDVGSSFLPLDGEIGEGEPQGGTHGVGGLSGASRTESMTNVVVSFLPFLFRWLLILLHPN